jgi:hypothetical protein
LLSKPNHLLPKKVPIQYGLKAVKDGIIRQNPLPEYWSSYGGDRSPAVSTLTLIWVALATISGTAISFFADQKARANVGVAPPKEWHLEYQGGAGGWVKVQAEYGTKVSDNPEEA